MRQAKQPQLSRFNSGLLLRARIVAPLNRPPIPDGAVLISGERIAGVGPWQQLAKATREQRVDLGEVILLPGLINAHCHLDYTDMAGQFLPPKIFTDWLKLITSTKAGWNYSDYLESWRHGADMLVRSGTTTVADIEAIPELLPQAWTTTPLRVFSFLEVTGIKSQRQPRAILKEAVERISTLGTARCRASLSPHAPYSTLPELLRLSAHTARKRKWLLTTHVAESAVEFEMFSEGRGEMFDWLERAPRDMADCGLGSPVQHLARCRALGDNLLAVHVNYLGRKDAALLARNKAHVVHCPRSHSYFRHDAFPLAKLRRAGVNVCLGTDSLASVCKARKQTVELSMFEEMRELASKQTALRSKTIVEMATISGARALGMEGEVGELSKSAFADLIAIPFTGKRTRVYDRVLEHNGDVVCNMIAGRWAISPKQIFQECSA